MTKLLDLVLPYRKLLTLLAVLAGAAAIYVWWQAAERDKASLIAAADNTCEAAGAPFRTEASGGKTVDLPKRQWGVACLAQVRLLRAFRDETNTGSIDALLDDLERREGKEAVDAALAAANSKRALDALNAMEAADAAVEDDRVGPGWFDALNDVGGLR